MRKLYLLAAIVVTAFAACSNKDDEIPYQPQKSVLDGIEINYFSIYHPGDTVQTALAYDEGVIKLSLISHLEDLSYRNNVGWGLVNSAYALSPVNQQYAVRGRYSVYALDTLYLSGQKIDPNSNLISYFRIAFTEGNPDSLVFPDEFDNLMLKSPPDSAINSLFQVKFKDENGDVFVSNTTRVLVKSK